MEHDPVEAVAHQVAVLARRAESARKSTGALDRAAYLLLAEIEQREAIGIAALADTFQLDVSTVSRQSAALEAKGLVERWPDPTDGRVSLLRLTADGHAQLGSARAARRALYSTLLADWSDDDRRALGALLARLNQAIAARDRRSPAPAGDAGAAPPVTAV
jgi:DNA-binding MarR family transcriptional regulator